MLSRRTLAAMALLAAAPLQAAEPAHPEPAHPEPAHPEPAAEKLEGRMALLPADSVTHHTLTLGSRVLHYTATAGSQKLRDDKGEVTAAVYSTAYTLDGAAPGTRPVTFFFNGGPGAGSAYLQLGAAGPRVLNFAPGHDTDGAAARLADNPDTWLPFTDMVFIDPVGTGYSIPAKTEEAPRRFWNVRGDADSLAKVINLWLIKNGRTESRKYLAGESWGGVRSIKVARALEHSQSVIVAGIVMVSPLLEEQYFFADTPLSYAFQIPTLAAAALERAGHFDPAAVDAAYRYATGPYVATLIGPPPRGEAATAFYHQVATLTGLPDAVVAKLRGELDPTAHDVRSQNGRLYSFYEMSQSIADPAPEGVDNGESPDPLLEGYGRAYGNAFAGYAADFLGFHTELTYRLLDDQVTASFDWKEEGHAPLSTRSDMRKLLALNPSLKILIVHGYFDTVCPFATSRWLAEHLPVGGDRVTVKAYQGGHMLYTRPAARAALARDVAAMIGDGSAAP